MWLMIILGIILNRFKQILSAPSQIDSPLGGSNAQNRLIAEGSDATRRVPAPAAVGISPKGWFPVAGLCPAERVPFQTKGPPRYFVSEAAS